MTKKLLAALIKLRDQGPRRPEFGICNNASLLVVDASPTDVYEAIKTLAKNWPDRDTTSSEDDPVGDYRYSRSTVRRWDNPRRHALLDFLIQELSK